ncbi:MAG: hypothetical protein HY782_20750 [Chloroflexi bacterium]|nr:hypothetical protein [Chloroflexota bacterium]
MSKRVAIVGGLVLVAVAFLFYYPGLRMGFYLDDYNYLERAGRTDWSNALAQIFDPRAQTMWYRPLQAIQFFLEFQILGNNPNAYHLVNVAYHAINLLLLYALAWRISKRWLIGLASALFYASFSVYVSGINWIGIVDPLAAMFYLSSIWFWWKYLEKQDRYAWATEVAATRTRSRPELTLKNEGAAQSAKANLAQSWQRWFDFARHKFQSPVLYALAFGSFVLALLSKQVSVTIPIVLFLAEWWLAGKPLLRSIPRAVRRYAPFVAGAVVFSLVQYTTQSTHTFAGVFGWQVGATMAFILVQYLVLFFFPWGVFPSLDINQVEAGDAVTYTWLAIALVIFVFVTWRTRSRALLFLSAFTLLNLVPVLPFPFIEHRYLYIPILSAGIMLALLFYQARAHLGERRWFASASAIGLALLLLGTGLALNESALAAAEWARQLRVPFRDIERQHATFPKDTLLYFIDPITPTEGGLSGMFFLRYDREITVKNWTAYANLREHNVSYVYYIDEARRPREIPVQKDAATQPSIGLPAEYAAPIRLEGYEVAQTRIQRGEPLILILYWRAFGPLDRRYTVFAQLVDRDGKIVAGYDSEPRKGQSPTTTWEPGRLNADAIVLPVGADVPPGSGYKLQLGLYHLPTQERVSVVNAEGQPVADAITIESFAIVE